MKTFHHIYLYRDSDSMPEDGWFQACFSCYAITSRLSFFKRIEKEDNIYEVLAYLCPQCTRSLNNKEKFKEKYTARCERYLRRNFPETLDETLD